MSQALLKMKRVRQQSYHGHSCVSIRNGHCSAIWGVIVLKFRCFHRLKSLQKWGETNNKQKKEHKKTPHNQTPRNRSSCLLHHTKMIEVQLLSSVLPLSPSQMTTKRCFIPQLACRDSTALACSNYPCSLIHNIH